MTARSYETIRVGLRRVIRDPNASLKAHMHAIKLLLYLEILMEVKQANGKPVSEDNMKANILILNELFEWKPRQKSRGLSPSG
jgi:hypothetical protein